MLSIPSLGLIFDRFSNTGIKRADICIFLPHWPALALISDAERRIAEIPCRGAC